MKECGDNETAKQFGKTRSVWCDQANLLKCKTCRFSHGKPPFADQPEKAYCQQYTREKGIQKPPGVLYEGKDCIYYEEV